MLLVLPRHFVAALQQIGIALKQVQVGLHHVFYQRRQVVLGLPLQFFLALGRVADEQFYFRRTEVGRVDAANHGANGNLVVGVVAGQFEAYFTKRHTYEVAHGGGHARSNNEVFGLLLLQNQPHGFYVVLGMAPVALGVEVAQGNVVAHAQRNLSHTARDFAGYEGFAAQGAFVVEHNGVAGKHAIGFAVVYRNPVAVELSHGVGRAGVERSGFALGHLLHQAVQLRGAGLVNLGFLGEAQQAHCFQNAERAYAVHVSHVLGSIERHLHVRHGAEVVNLIGLHFLNDANQVGGVGQVAVVVGQAGVFVPVLIGHEVVDTVGVEQRGAALDAVHVVTLFEQKLGEVGTVLAGDAGDEGNFHKRGKNVQRKL